MRRWTLEEIKNKLKDDYDLWDEDFVDDDELTAHINEGIDDCEAEIHALGRENKYFRKRGTLSLVQGQNEIDLPADIYADKILKLLYVNGSTRYTVTRIRGEDMYEDIEETNTQNPNENYRYILVSQTAGEGDSLFLVPAARATESNTLVLWYIRNANRLEADADYCDIPEFVYYVMAFAAYKVLFKEGHPATVEAKAEMERLRTKMVETLTEQVPDGDDKLVMDFSHYEESN